MEPRGHWFVRAPTHCCAGGWGGQSSMTVAPEDPRQTSWVVATCYLPLMPGIWGPNRAHIVLDSCDLLSRLLFVEMRVESKLSSSGVGTVGGSFSLGNASWLLGNDTSSFCLEFVRLLLGCQLWERPDEDTWICKTSFSSLSLLVSRSRVFTCRSLSCWRLSMFSRYSK